MVKNLTVNLLLFMLRKNKANLLIFTLKKHTTSALYAKKNKNKTTVHLFTFIQNPPSPQYIYSYLC